MLSTQVFRRTTLIGLSLLLLSLAGNARAVLVVDTGPGGMGTSGPVVNSSQWLAGLFSLTDTYQITSVEGWLGNTGSDGTATAAIYSDSGGGVPVSELFSQQFVLEADTTAPITSNWDGAFGLSWTLGPGDYWLSFEVRPGDTLLFAVMGNNFNSNQGAPNPLADYAVASGGNWNSLISDYAFGMRIDAVAPSAVPIPAAVWLFATAIAGLAGFGQRRKTA